LVLLTRRPFSAYCWGNLPRRSLLQEGTGGVFCAGWFLSDRLILFVDAQNVYRGARTAFLPPERRETEPHVFGQVNPLLLGQRIAARTVGDRPPRSLVEVRVYTGRPDATRDPHTYAAHMRQCASWEKTGITVVPRTLRYPRDYPSSRAVEKGIDVALAIDFVAHAVDGLFDVGVIVSKDTDLRPALEYVVKKCSSSCIAEVASWHSEYSKGRLSISTGNIWCHFLDFNDYVAVHDPTDYNV
jgi:hypothetical protein